MAVLQLCDHSAQAMELGELLVLGPPLLNHVEDGTFYDVLDALDRRHNPDAMSWYTVHALAREEMEAVPILAEAWCKRPHDDLLHGRRQFHWVPAGDAGWKRILSLVNCVAVIHPEKVPGCEEVVAAAAARTIPVYLVTFGEDGTYSAHLVEERPPPPSRRRPREDTPMTETEFRDTWK